MFYPDNQDRQDRANQLLLDCQAFHQQMKDESKKLVRKKVDYTPVLNKILKENNMTTFSELKERVSKGLTAEKKKEYENFMQLCIQSDNTYDSIGELTTILGFTTGAVWFGANVIKFSLQGALVVGIKQFTVGLKAIFDGKIIQGIKAVFRAAKITKAYSATANLGKGAKLFGQIGKVASVFTKFLFVVEAVVLIIEVLDRKNRKEELQEAIKDLFSRRLMMKVSLLNAMDAASYASSLDFYVTNLKIIKNSKKMTKEQKDSALQAQGKKIATSISDLWATTAETAVELRKYDSNRSSWTNEDPSFEETEIRIAKIDAEEQAYMEKKIADNKAKKATAKK